MFPATGAAIAATGAAIENDRRGHLKWPARPSKMTGAAIETYRRGHRNLPVKYMSYVFTFNKSQELGRRKS